jgi:hypothetical protein
LRESHLAIDASENRGRPDKDDQTQSPRRLRGNCHRTPRP